MKNQTRRVSVPSTAFIMAMVACPGLVLAQDGPPPSSEPAAASAPTPVAEDLSQRLDKVDERSRIVERKLEIFEEEAAKARSAPVVTAGEQGFALRSADGAFVVKIRGLLHADAREYLGDDLPRTNSTFVLRRARPLLEASFYDVADFRIMTDFGNGQALVQDAYGDLRPFAWLKLRVGKFKPPVGLERLQSAF